jgi:AcrR family transcriptional regulator
MLTNEVKLDPRVKRTRQLLQQALGELLTRKSFEEISVQDIAAQAGVNRATFYKHFTDKYHLLNESVREMFQERLARKIPDVPTFSLHHLRLLTLTVCEFLGEFIGHCVPARHNNDQAVMVLQVRAILYEVILAWVKDSARHRLPANLAPEVVAKVTSWAIFGVVMEWSQSGRKQTPAQLTEEVLSLLVSGLKMLLL